MFDALYTFPCRLHSGRHVDGVAEQAVPGHGRAYHPCGTPSRVKTNPKLQLGPRKMADLEVGDSIQQVQRHVGDLPGVFLPVPAREAAYTHVGITDSLHLTVKK